MAKPEKATAVAEITEQFKSSTATVVTEYRGLSVANLAELRRSGISCPGLLADKSMKAQMRSAGSSGARWAIILGDQELQDKSAMVKDLSNSSQLKVPLEGLIKYLKDGAGAGKAS